MMASSSSSSFLGRGTIMFIYSINVKVNKTFNTFRMGDNAKQSWSWHNNEIGQGYQAKGVIRQNYGIHHHIVVSC